MPNKPKPTSLKVISGTARADRVNKKEPKPSANKVKMPSDLSPDAKKCWKQIASQLKDCGILTNIDQQALVMYCESFSAWKNAQKALTEEGQILKGLDGIPYLNPHFKLAGKYFDQCRMMLIEFGMTPSSRTKVVKVDSGEKNDNPWEKI